MSPNEKNKLAGIFLMAHGGLLGLMYLVFFGFFMLIMLSDPNAPQGFFGIFFGFLAVFSMIFVLPQIIGGWKMYKKSPNSKVWGIIASVLACMNVPLGTAAGVFALVFLLSDEGNNFYNQQSQPKYLGEFNQVDEMKINDFHHQERPEMHGWK